MVRLKGFPKNKDKFVKLIAFLKEVLEACKSVDISPIVEASLAVFAYTGDQDLDVNDVDMLIQEDKFPDLMKVFDQVGINYELKDYHVLRVFKDDLKLEFDSIDHWSRVWGITIKEECSALQVDDLRLSVIDLPSLIQTYEFGMQQKNTPHERYRHKLQILRSVKNQ